MIRSIRIPVAVLGLLAAAASAAQGQVGVFATAGATLPMGDYGDYAKTGWLASGGVRIPLSKPAIAVTVEGFYGGNSHEISSEKTALYGALGGVVYRFGDVTRPGLFVIGNVGMMVHSFKDKSNSAFDESANGVAFGGGAGLSVPYNNMSLISTVRYITASIENESTAFVAIQAGVRINLGAKK